MADEARKAVFLRLLREQLHDPDKIDIALLSRESTKPPVGLAMLDAYGIFNPDGSINQAMAEKHKIKVDESRLDKFGEDLGLTSLSFRESLILDAAIYRVGEILKREDVDRVQVLEEEFNREVKGLSAKERETAEIELANLQIAILANKPELLAGEIFEHLHPKRQFKFIEPLSTELTRAADAMLAREYYEFKGTNISISPGPKQTESAPGPYGYEAEKGIFGFLDNLTHHPVAHVFAMGLTYPYHPQDGVSEAREVLTDTVIPRDFINYFIPDLNGVVRLPDLPELKGLHVTSKPIRKVGRFTSYEISINGSEPIQVHHFPMRDKQPLELTDEELAYLKTINATTPKEKSIHTHCRGGKGRSGQMAFLLASESGKYQSANAEEQLMMMRLEKYGDEKSFLFIETPFQEAYLAETKPKMHSEELMPLIDESGVVDDEYFILSLMIKSYIDEKIEAIGFPSVQAVSQLNPEQQQLLALMEAYKTFLSAPENGRYEVRVDISKLPIVSNAFKAVLDAEDVLYAALFYTLEQEETDNVSLLLDKMLSHKQPNELISRINEYFESKRGAISSVPGDDQEGKLVALSQTQAQLLEQVTSTRIRQFERLEQPAQEALEQTVVAHFSEVAISLTEYFDPERTGNITVKEEKFEAMKVLFSSVYNHVKALSQKNGKSIYDMLGAEQDYEHLFGLKYTDLTLQPTELSQKALALEARLGALLSDNQLDDAAWHSLQSTFKGYKILFDTTDLEIVVRHEQRFHRLNHLFQSARTSLYSPQAMGMAELENKTPIQGESCADYLSSIMLDVLVVLTELNYPDAEIEALQTAFDSFIDTYIQAGETDVVDLQAERQLPSAQDYQQAILDFKGFLKRQMPTLSHSNALLLRAHSLYQDVLRYRADHNYDTAIYEQLSQQFEDLQYQYGIANPEKDSELINEKIERIDASLENLNQVIDAHKKSRISAKLAISEQALIDKLPERKTEALRIKAARDASDAREIKEVEDEIHFWDEQAEEKTERGLDYPRRPKLIVFDVDDTLVDLEKGELKRKDELIQVLKYAKTHNIAVAIATNRTPSLDGEQAISVSKLRAMIRDETGIDISGMMTFLHTDSISKQMQIFIKKIDTEIQDIKAKRLALEKQLPRALDKVTLEQEIDALKVHEKALNDKLFRLASGKNIMLDAIKMHYHQQHDVSDESLQAKVIEQFFTRQFLEQVDPEHRNTAKWDTLLTIAKAMAASPKLTHPKPSFSTILKDLIFGAHRPERLKKQYGDLKAFEGLASLAEDQAYFKKHLDSIVSYCETALARSKVLIQPTLAEDDVVFLDDNQQIVSDTLKTTNYRAVKVSGHHETSFRYMVDFNYELGAYNGVIAFLNDDRANAPAHYGPDKINKTLSSYLKKIPKFNEHGFQHTPIVKHVSLSRFIDKLPTLDASQATQARYKQQFIESGIERFDELSKDRQDDLVKTVYQTMQAQLKSINDSLKQLKDTPPEARQDTLRADLTSLKQKIDSLLALDKRFTAKLGPSFITIEAKLYRKMIVSAIFSGSLEHLTVDLDDASKVVFESKHSEIENVIAQDYLTKEAIHLPQMHDTLIDEVSATLTQTDKIKGYYEQKVKTLLIPALRSYVQECDSVSSIPYLIEEDDIALTEALAYIQHDIQDLIASDEKETLPYKLHREVSHIETLLAVLPEVEKYQSQLDAFAEVPIPPRVSITALKGQCAELKQALEREPQYQAKLFCDKAEAYLKAPERRWKVGFQFTKHFIEGTDRKIPKTVARQLAIIKQAHANGDYVTAKQDFLKIGVEKQRSRFSSKASNQYFSLFKPKSDRDADHLPEDIEQEFNSPTVGKPKR